MKKSLLSLAIVFALPLVSFAEHHEEGKTDEVKSTTDHQDGDLRTAHKSIGNPAAQAVVGTVTTPLGNTIHYTISVAKHMENRVRQTLSAVVDSSKCVAELKHPGEFVACGIRFGGDVLLAIPQGTVELGAKTVYYVVAVPTDILDVWADAFEACSDYLGEVAGIPCRVINVVLDGSGKIVRATAGSAVGYVQDGTSGGLKAASSMVEIPVGLFNLDFAQMGGGVVNSVKYSLCTLADVTVVGLVGILKRLVGKDHTPLCDIISQKA